MDIAALETLKGQPHLDDLHEVTDPADLARMRAIIDRLLERLIAAGESAKQKKVVGVFRRCIRELNRLDQKDGCIDTDEREALCPYLDQIAELCGLHPYDDESDHEWIDDWRDW